VTAPTPGLVAEITHLVGEGDTATAMGSGDVPVLATPRLLALAESATVAAIAGTLSSDTTSVGTRVELEHLVASPVGARVSVRAELVGVDGRMLRFEIVAEHPDGRVVAHGRISRVVVDRVRFLQRSGAPER
jgi:predicted thioesterase